MQVKIYHAPWDEMDRDERWNVMRGDVFDVRQTFLAGRYNIAATLEIVRKTIPEVLEIAFEKTNHINYHWWENEEVINHVLGSRSTSVGDVAVVNGDAYLCARAGWQKIA